MSNEKINLDDLLGGEEEERPSVPVPQQPPAPKASGRLGELKKKFQEINERLAHALEHNYDGYKVDTGQDGQPHFGTKGYAKYERDKLERENLRDQIRELEQTEREDKSEAQASMERAKQIVKRVFEEEIKYVNRDHRDEVQQIYVNGLRQVNWADPSLRTDIAKEGMLQMIFGYAAQHVRKQKQAAGKASSGERIDAGHEDAGSDDGEVVENDYGWQDGSLGHKITERYEERLKARQRGPLGRRSGS